MNNNPNYARILIAGIETMHMLRKRPINATKPAISPIWFRCALAL